MPKTKKEPAFPVPPQAGFTKEEFAAVVITGGIFAGPYGKVVMESTGTDQLEAVADTALDMYSMVQRRIQERAAA